MYAVQNHRLIAFGKISLRPAVIKVRSGISLVDRVVRLCLIPPVSILYISLIDQSVFSGKISCLASEFGMH